jgi:hypothetical protein
MSKDKHTISSVTAGDVRSGVTSGNDWHMQTSSGGAGHDELAERLAQADLQLCEMQAHMDELIEANLRLRVEVSEMTLKWLTEKTDAR